MNNMKDEDGHMGKHVLNSLKKYENETNQIEIVTGTVETHGSVRIRTIRMAEALKAKGIKIGDVILLAAVNHNDLCIPYLAALCIGAIPLGLAVDMKYLEVKHILSMGRPRMVFADPITIPIIQKVSNDIELCTEIVVFSEDKIDGCDNFSNYVKETGTEDTFCCENFDPKTTIGVLSCSSGSTGLPKLVALSHYGLYSSICRPGPIVPVGFREKFSLVYFSPVHWISGPVNILSSCCIGHPRIHSIRPYSMKDFDMASKLYKPSSTLMNQVALCKLIDYAENNAVDFSHFHTIFYGGSTVSNDILEKLRKLVPNTILAPSYASTEVLFVTNGMVPYRLGSCGKPASNITWKVVDLETKEKLGPNQPGELRLRAAHSFMCYYNDPEATTNAFDDDGWFKTGDLMYYDEENYFFFVDRIKDLIKFRNHHVSSTELENVITDLPGVLLAAVVGKPHYEDGEHPMAFVQLKPETNVSAKEIKDYINENLSDTKRLRAGVVFLDAFPMTRTGKIDRKKLHDMKITYKGE